MDAENTDKITLRMIIWISPWDNVSAEPRSGCPILFLHPCLSAFIRGSNFSLPRCRNPALRRVPKNYVIA